MDINNSDYKEICFYKEQKFVFVDLETTNSNNGLKIIEIALIFTDINFNIIGSLDSLINPWVELDPSLGNNIYQKDVVKAPLFEDLAASIAYVLDKCILGGHNVESNLEILNEHFKEADVDFSPGEPFCTLKFADKLQYPTSLTTLAEILHLNVPNHSALLNAVASVQIGRTLRSMGNHEQVLEPAQVTVSSQDALRRYMKVWDRSYVSRNNIVNIYSF